jgi:hypothetical protein
LLPTGIGSKETFFDLVESAVVNTSYVRKGKRFISHGADALFSHELRFFFIGRGGGQFKVSPLFTLKAAHATLDQGKKVRASTDAYLADVAALFEIKDPKLISYFDSWFSPVDCWFEKYAEMASVVGGFFDRIATDKAATLSFFSQQYVFAQPRPFILSVANS